MFIAIVILGLVLDSLPAFVSAVMTLRWDAPYTWRRNLNIDASNSCYAERTTMVFKPISPNSPSKSYPHLRPLINGTRLSTYEIPNLQGTRNLSEFY